MFCSFNLVVLAALRDGVVLHDNGMWRTYQDRFRRLVKGGQLVAEHRGWHWTEEAYRIAAAG